MNIMLGSFAHNLLWLQFDIYTWHPCKLNMKSKKERKKAKSHLSMCMNILSVSTGYARTWHHKKFIMYQSWIHKSCVCVWWMSMRGFSYISNWLFDCRWTRQRAEPQEEGVGAGSARPSHRRPVYCNLQGSCLWSRRQGSVQSPNHEQQWNQIK